MGGSRLATLSVGDHGNLRVEGHRVEGLSLLLRSDHRKYNCFSWVTARITAVVQAEQQAQRPKACKHAGHDRLRGQVRSRVEEVLES